MLTEYQQAMEKYRQRVFSFAYYSLRARADAEDVTQEVFIRLWQHWRSIDQSRIGAWLMRVSHNAVIDLVRHRKSRGESVELLDDQLSDDQEPALDLETLQLRRVLEEAIGELDDPYRSILIMRDIQGLSYQEIRQCLDLSESQVKVYLHRARRKLRENEALRRVAGNAAAKAGSVASKESQPQQLRTHTGHRHV